MKSNLSVDKDEFILVEKYRPKNIEDITLTNEYKNKFKAWFRDGEIPNLLLSSKAPGLGKSSLAHTIIHELNAEALFINASMYPNIDILRNKIKGFASTASFDGRAKVVILDEADFLNANSVQPALRGFIEQFSKNCRFVLTCNYKDKIIEPIQNRLIEIDFDMMFNLHKTELITQMFLRTKEILSKEQEDISYNPEDLKYLIKHYYPSSRTVIGKIQDFTTIIGGVKTLIINKESIDSDKVNENLLKSILANDFKAIRMWCEKLSDPSIIFSSIYEHIDEFPQDVRPKVIITVAKYSAWNSTVRDRLVNSVACATEVGAFLG